MLPSNWNGESFFLCYRIKLPEVHTNPYLPARFLGHHNRRASYFLDFEDDTCLSHIRNLFLHFTLVFWIRPSLNNTGTAHGTVPKSRGPFFSYHDTSKQLFQLMAFLMLLLSVVQDPSLLL